MKERDFKKAFVAGTRHQCKWTPIESMVSAGVPDLSGIATFGKYSRIRSVDLWVEVKMATDSGRVKVQPSQIAWHKDRYRHGAHNLFVACRHMESIVVSEATALYELIKKVKITELKAKHEWFKKGWTDEFGVYHQGYNWDGIMDFMREYVLTWRASDGT